jgi:hypothetical protein
MKRYIYIIIGIIVAAAIAILVLFFIKNKTASTTLNAFGTPSGSLPITGTQGGNASGIGGAVAALGLTPIASGTPAASGQVAVQKFGVLSDAPILDYFINPQNNITAIEPTGAVITISNGQSTVINSSTASNIISASFSYDGEKIVLSYGDVADPQTAIFDVASNTWAALPKGIQSPQWSPINNYQIAYLTPTTGGKLLLSVVDAANIKKGSSAILSLNANDLSLQWPVKNEFILSDKPTFQNAGAVWVFNSQIGTLNPLIYEVSGAEGIWSHNATIPYGLTFFNNPTGQGDILQLQPSIGTLPTQPLNFLTLPSKCVLNTELMPIASSSTITNTTSSIASSTPSSTKKTKVAAVIPAATSTPYLALYCGVPRSSSGFSSAHLPDDYNTLSLLTSDDLYKVNTATGAEQVLWSDASQNMDASNVKFFNNALFFINRYDNKLYGLTFN